MMQFSIIFFSPEILGFISLKSCKIKTSICEKHCVEASSVISAESGEDIFCSSSVRLWLQLRCQYRLLQNYFTDDRKILSDGEISVNICVN